MLNVLTLPNGQNLKDFKFLVHDPCKTYVKIVIQECNLTFFEELEFCAVFNVLFNCRKIIPLPMYRASIQTCPEALFDKMSTVMAIYPQVNL